MFIGSVSNLGELLMFMLFGGALITGIIISVVIILFMRSRKKNDSKVSKKVY